MDIWFADNFTLLLQLPTKLNSVDGKGDMPLDLALCSNQTSIAKTLIEHGANPDATDSKGWTLLYKALDRGIN